MSIKRWPVEFYADARGRTPAYEFIESLPPGEHAAALRALDLLARYGPRLGMPHARHIEGLLWELRAGPGRLFYFPYLGELRACESQLGKGDSQALKRFIILHAYRKRTPKAPKREIETAIRRMSDILER